MKVVWQGIQKRQNICFHTCTHVRTHTHTHTHAHTCSHVRTRTHTCTHVCTHTHRVRVFDHTVCLILYQMCLEVGHQTFLHSLVLQTDATQYMHSCIMSYCQQSHENSNCLTCHSHHLTPTYHSTLALQNPTARVLSTQSRPKSKWRPLPLDTVVGVYVYCKWYNNYISSDQRAKLWEHQQYSKARERAHFLMIHRMAGHLWIKTYIQIFVHSHTMLRKFVFYFCPK